MFQAVSRFFGFGGSESYRRSPPLILINGLAEQTESWFLSRNYWQQRFDVRMPGFLVYDGPALQERIRHGRGISVDYLTDRLSNYLDNFVQSPPYHLVASSLGCQIAVEYAVRHPEKVNRVVMLCPSGMGCDERLPIVEGVRHHDYQALVSSVFYDQRRATPEVVRYFEKKFSSRVWRKALLQTVRGTKRHSVREKLPYVQSQTLVICGREDQIVDPYHVQSAVEGLPNFKFVMVPRCGHAPQLERPRLINPMVSQFLDEAPVVETQVVEELPRSRRRGALEVEQPEPQRALA